MPNAPNHSVPDTVLAQWLGITITIGPESSVVGRIIAPWERMLHLPGILVDAPALGCVDDVRVIRR